MNLLILRILLELMPDELLALPISSQVPYELLALVFLTTSKVYLISFMIALKRFIFTHKKLNSQISGGKNKAGNCIIVPPFYYYDV